MLLVTANTKTTATSRIHMNHSLKTSDSHKEAELGQGEIGLTSVPFRLPRSAESSEK